MTTTSTSPLARPEGVLQVAFSADLTGPASEPTLGELSQPAHLLPATATMAAVDLLFRRDAALRWVVVTAPGAPQLVSRSWFELAMTGRLGYGRLLLQRRPVLDAAPPTTLAFAFDCPIATVAAAVIARRSGGDALLDAVLVTGPDGALSVAPVTAVFEQLAQRYAYQALHDPLTGLPNRLFLLERLRQAHAAGTTGVLFSIDLDRFKDTNDHLGHAAGDDVLVEFAARLRTVARTGDLVVRLGGDEFAVLTEAPLSAAQSTALAERIVLTAAAPYVVTARTGPGGEHLVSLGASVGVAGASGAGDLTPDALLHQADLAVHQAKSLGRGRVAHFGAELLEDAEPSDAVRAQHAMERRLRQAIESQALQLHYQPVVSLPSAQVIGVEALARWEDEELGRVAPDRFIPLAERTGLIVDLGRWVLQTACREAAGWAAGPSGLLPTVAVNVSPVQLAQRGFIDDVTAALTDSGLAPDRLCLEITETAAITDLDATAARLAQVRDLGVRLALDDFGTGHSALSLLRALPVHLVKIDRSFIEQVASDTADAVLARLVIEAAHSLGRRVCAEGVETAEQAQQLVAMGCDSAQGWLFGRPEPASPRLAALLTSRALSEPLAAGAVLPLGNDELVLVTTPGRIVTYASATSQAVLGWLPQEITGTDLTSSFYLDDPAPTGPWDDGTAVHRVRHRDGSVRWLESTTRQLTDDAGRVREVLSVSRDVTATVQARRALTDSELMFRHAFDDAPIGMLLARTDGTLLRANRAFSALLGTGTEALQHRRVQDLTPVADRAGQFSAVRALFAVADGRTELSTSFRHADGSDVPVTVRVSVVRDADGAPTSVFAHVLPEPARVAVPV
ncbi:EAL domain-containing protein [Modestobacter sp. SSW1-42]|uniref:EAL domain-containing protein n=1 Tax=Modestobacter sp. SSW1-42 TaxID=596372 RepID=UPI0039858BC8